MSQVTTYMSIDTLSIDEKQPHQKEPQPCAICGKTCPNDAYCVYCGYVHDPVIRKHQTPELIQAENERKNRYSIKEPDHSKKPNNSDNKSWLRIKMAKIGREFKRQHGRVAEAGDIVRRRNRDGVYDKRSKWYIKTKQGWRASPSNKRKPTKSQIKRVCLGQNG